MPVSIPSHIGNLATPAPTKSSGNGISLFQMQSDFLKRAEPPGMGRNFMVEELPVERPTTCML